MMTRLSKTEILARLYDILSTKEDMDAFEEFIAERTNDRGFRLIDRMILDAKIQEEADK